LANSFSGKCVKPDSLTKATSGTFPVVAFEDGAQQYSGFVYAGQHRQEALKMVLASTLEELAKIDRKLANDKGNQNLVDQQMRLIKILREKGLWLVAFYDTGMLFFWF
jgi:hypothetical protein